MEDTSAQVDRRQVLCLAAAAVAASAVPVVANGGPADVAENEIAILEGTNIAACLSSDGGALAFDLYGVLWIIPSSGGMARRLTDDMTGVAQPHWSPDGQRIVFQSFRDGTFQIWWIRPDGSDLEQLTEGPYDCREPQFSPGGDRIAFASDRGGSYAIYVLDLTSRAVTLWAVAEGEAASPAWAPDGERIGFVANRHRLEIVDAAGGRMGIPIGSGKGDATLGDIRSPVFAPDGTGIVYAVVGNGVAELHGPRGPIVRGRDVFPFRPSWAPDGSMIFTSDGAIQRLSTSGEITPIPFEARLTLAKPHRPPRQPANPQGRFAAKGIADPALSPDGATVAFRALNALWLLKDGKATRLVSDGFWVCDPAWSPDGRQLAYSTDRAGSLDIWVRDLESGEERQLTSHRDAALSAAWSRDGSKIAFLDQNGALHTVDVASGHVRQIFEPLWEPGKPSWGPDGDIIALAAFKPYSARFRDGLNEFLILNFATGVATYQPALPHKSVSTRGADGPVWSPNGRHFAFVLGSRLWIVSVDRRGVIDGAPVALNDEPTDAPTWSGDSHKLLYLSNGHLRLIDIDGGAPKTVAHDVTWARPKTKERLVIRPRGLWDGTGSALREKTDVLVIGDKIAALLPAGSHVAGARSLEVPDAVLIPGLVDMHAHRQMQGYGYGDREGRLWLSLGVTTTRSPGSPAYQMVEERESVAAGARVGPRHFGTGEPLDGARVLYGFMRPVTEPGQMQLEFSRAGALDYDLLKSYMRQSYSVQQQMAVWAHAHDISVTSHFHFPALKLGFDGMEHMGAANPLGYSRASSVLGLSYQDVTALFTASGAARTPTLFNAASLYGTDRSLVDDPRIATFYPAWELAKLKARAAKAAVDDESVSLALLERNVGHLKVILHGGGRVVTGTDSPIDFNGISLHMNLRAMVRYGLTPVQALTTATRFAGELLRQPLGVISPGMFADLVVLEGDPLMDISQAASVRFTIANGRVFDQPSLAAPFVRPSVTADAPKPSRRVVAQSPFWWHATDYVEGNRRACCTDSECHMPLKG